MAHDVFISYSSSDKTVADAVCAALENVGIRSWIAPRDVQLGRSFAGEIARAIQNSEIMVLIFSARSNDSEQVLREVQLAVNAHLHIIQFRIEDVHLNDDLSYFLSSPHWLDALTPPLQAHTARLTASIKTLLAKPTEISAQWVTRAVSSRVTDRVDASAAATRWPELAWSLWKESKWLVLSAAAVIILFLSLWLFYPARAPETQVANIIGTKEMLGDTSTNGPGLIVGPANKYVLAWIGNPNLQLNLLSRSPDSGWGPKNVRLNTSPAAPAMAYFNGNYVVGWIGFGNNQINVMQSQDGTTWGSQITLGDTSQSAPAMAVLNGKLYLAWRGVGNDQLNIMTSATGQTWQNKVTLGDTTTSGPALAVNGNSLFIAWRDAETNQLNVMSSSNGQTWENKVTLADTTTARPALVSSAGRIGIVWQDAANNRINYRMSGTNGSTWLPKRTSTETCFDGPAVVPFMAQVLIAWTGTDPQHHLSLAPLSIY